MMARCESRRWRNFNRWRSLDEESYRLESCAGTDRITESAVRFVPDYVAA